MKPRLFKAKFYNFFFQTHLYKALKFHRLFFALA